MTLLVTKESGTTKITICNETATGFTGVLTCNSTGYSGTLTGTVYRTASPLTIIARKIVDTVSTAFRGATGLFIGFFLFLTMVLIGIASPAMALILGVVALFPAVLLGAINWAIFIGFAILAFLAWHFMERT
jgi:hypothetical protein